MSVPHGYSKEEFVHSVFTKIAYRYDLMNTVLSFNRDKYWRSFAVARAELQPGDHALDVCCGTGMLALAQAQAVGPTGRVTGLDFCDEMLKMAQKNIASSSLGEIIHLVQGNAMALPWADNVFNCATIGFALRNVPDIRRTLAEMTRVVKPGGKVVSLELAKPSTPVFKQIYYLYFELLVPLLGRLGVGQSGPYNWLPASLRTFPHQKEICGIFAEIGLHDVQCYELSGGIVAVHVGTKPLK